MRLFPTRMFWMIIFACLLALSVAAQTAEPPTGKVIEVHSDGVRPASQIALRRDRPNGFWTSSFPRIKDWQLPDGQEPIRVIELTAKLVDGKAEVFVSTFSGKRFGEKVNVIAQRQMVEGDSVTIPELKKYGFEPLTLKMVSVTPTLATFPIVVNRSQSIRVSVEFTTSTLPTFTVSLVNDSAKAVWGLPWHTEKDGRMGISSLGQGRYGRSLIEPNGQHQISVRGSASEQLKFVIDAVIFEDGSVEGDANAAGTFHAFTRGRRTALERIVPILRTHLQASKIDIAKLIERVDATDGALPAAYTGPGDVAIKSVVKETLDGLRTLQSGTEASDEAALRRALTEFTNAYEDWRARLQKYP